MNICVYFSFLGLLTGSARLAERKREDRMGVVEIDGLIIEKQELMLEKLGGLKIFER